MNNDNTEYLNRQQQEDLRALQDTLYVLSGKWKLPIMFSMCNENRRFSDLARSIPGITKSMLSKELKEMEQNKLIVRTVYPETPVVIEYSATEYSHSLVGMIEAMIDWGKQHREMIRQQ